MSRQGRERAELIGDDTALQRLHPNKGDRESEPARVLAHGDADVVSETEYHAPSLVQRLVPTRGVIGTKP
jgi:hypothetical protein